MPSLSQSSGATSASLLGRITASDPEAWSRFAAIYAPLVYAWARRGGLQEHDAEDVVQDVFRTVLAKIGDFQKDGQNSQFRGWLWAITCNRVRLFYRQAGPGVQAVGGSVAAEQMQQLPDMLEHDSDPTSQGEQAALLGRALATIRDDFSEPSWQAFWRVAIGGQAAADVAQDLKMSTSAVRQAKYRVLCRLREELAGL